MSQSSSAATRASSKLTLVDCSTQGMLIIVSSSISGSSSNDNDNFAGRQKMTAGTMSTLRVSAALPREAKHWGRPARPHWTSAAFTQTAPPNTQAAILKVSPVDPTVGLELLQLLSHLRSLTTRRRSAMSRNAESLGLAAALTNQGLAARKTFSLDFAKNGGYLRSQVTGQGHQWRWSLGVEQGILSGLQKFW